jgi:hypothetical protein
LATEIAPTQDPSPARARRRGVLVFLIALLPAVAAVWGVRWFVTQDGPAHLYNAHIIAASRDPSSPFRDYYTVSWEPLPNWGGHLLTVALVSALPLWASGPAVTTVTLIAFAASVAWLRARVVGSGMAMASALAVLLALNMTWLFGFTSFVLGACLFPVTLGVWWAGRDRLGRGRVAAVAGLLVLGYFCHLVSLGLTAVGLVVLAALTPGPRRADRLVRTGLALLPLLPLGGLYLSQSRRGGRMQLIWGHLNNPFLPKSWREQLSWVDPITLAAKDAVPLTGLNTPWFGLLAPTVWLTVALILMWVSTVVHRPADAPRRPGERSAWAWLATLLLVGGLVGPDSLGPTHGEYLPQRVVLLGLVALVPVLNLEPKGRSGRLAGAALGVALAVQSAVVWDYALASRRTAGAIADARDAVGCGERVATLLIDIRGRGRANPLLHADNLLGVGTGNVVWSNYETRYYYFPVQFRAGLDRPGSTELEMVAITDDPKDVDKRACLWECLVEDHIDAIDKVVVWGSEPKLDAINGRWFETVYWKGNVRVLRPRQAENPALTRRLSEATQESVLSPEGAAGVSLGREPQDARPEKNH